MTYEIQRSFALKVVKTLRETDYIALWAGGCVRDLLLQRVPKDYDVATNATPQEVRKLFGHRKTIAVGESFGVIIVMGTKEEGQVEVATFRNDGSYLDGRRPSEVVFSTPEEDALRRDFTINGMFYDPIREQVIDYVEGETDLEQGIVRAIGDAHERIQEDKLRMLRAVRFTATFDFELERNTALAIHSLASEISVVSAERISQELKRMLEHSNRKRAVELLAELHLLQHILPEVIIDQQTEHNSQPELLWNQQLDMLGLLPPDRFEVSLATLFQNVTTNVDEICQRLRLSNKQTDRVCFLIEHKHEFRDSGEIPLHRLKTLLISPGFEDLMTFCQAKATVLADDQQLVRLEKIQNYWNNTDPRVINPPQIIDGNDLIKKGISPGPGFKDLLNAIRNAQLDEEIFTRKEALEMLDCLVSE